MLYNSKTIKYRKMINREEILETLVPMETETKLKAWLFQIEKKFYHVAEYGGVYRVPPTTSIWECNKRGKRLTEKPLHKIDRQDRLTCINQFFDILDEKEMEKEIENETK